MLLQRSRDVLSTLVQAACHSRGTASRAISTTCHTLDRPSSQSTDPKEVEKFAALASEWWSPSGPFRALHALNNARVHFIRDVARHALPHDAPLTAPLQGLKVLDVGCGGGILAEALARLGGTVTAIDVTTENIMVAKEHMSRDPSLPHDLRYMAKSAESLLAEAPGAYDVVVSSEVIEHVAKPLEFCQTLRGLTAPQGCVVITTFNRTPASYALAIVAAERVLGMVPQGAHDWNKFISPEELAVMFSEARMSMSHLCGMQLSAATRKWQCVENTAVNYAAAFVHADRQADVMLAAEE